MDFGIFVEEKMARGGVVGGSVERLGRLRDDLSLNGVIAELNPGGMLSMEQMLRAIA